MALQERWNRGSFPGLNNGICFYSTPKKAFDVRNTPYSNNSSVPRMTYHLLGLNRWGTRIIVSDTVTLITTRTGRKFSQKLIFNDS